VCESCNDIVKKPAVKKHRFQCDAAAFSCIDCNRTFVGANVDAHTSCISEAEKYQGALFTPKKRGNSNNNNSNESAAVALAATSSGGGGNQSNSIADSNNAHGNHDSNGRDHVINSSAPLDFVLVTRSQLPNVPKRNPIPHIIIIIIMTTITTTKMILIFLMMPINHPPILPPFSTKCKTSNGKRASAPFSNPTMVKCHSILSLLSSLLPFTPHSPLGLTAVVEAKVRSSKKLKLVTGTDGRTIVTTQQRVNQQKNKFCSIVVHCETFTRVPRPNPRSLGCAASSLRSSSLPALGNCTGFGSSRSTSSRRGGHERTTGGCALGDSDCRRSRPPLRAWRTTTRNPQSRRRVLLERILESLERHGARRQLVADRIDATRRNLELHRLLA
jgi:hypothetical protein